MFTQLSDKNLWKTFVSVHTVALVSALGLLAGCGPSTADDGDREHGVSGSEQASPLVIGNLCNAVALGASPASPQSLGVSVTLNGSAACTGSAPPEYAFFIKRPGTTAYAPLRSGWGGPTLVWNSSAEGVGEYSFLVYARASGNDSTFESQATLAYRVGETCTLGTPTASPASPAAFGTAVSLGATATCTGGTSARYRFSARPNGASTWTIVRDWGAAASASWNTAGLSSNLNTLRFEARASDFSGTATSTKTMTYLLGQVCNSLTVSTSPANRAERGTTVTITGSATCPLGGSAEYQFFTRKAGTTAWTLIRDWASAASAVWNTANLELGQHQLRVDARGQGHAAAESSRSVNYSISGPFIKQFGSGVGWAIAADPSGNAYVTGMIDDPLDGIPVEGTDVFLVKYGPDGARAWTRVLNAEGTDQGLGITATASNVYVAGQAWGAFPGNVGAGGYDAFVAKYTSSGAQAWVRQFGTPGNDGASGVSTDSSGNVYVTGCVDTGNGLADVIVAKYSASGNPSWTRQFGSSDFDCGIGISAPDSGGNVYVTGTNYGSGGLFLAKFSSDGQRAWVTRGIPPSVALDRGTGVVVSAGRVYVAGSTLLDGDWRALIVAYDTNGNVIWNRQSVPSAVPNAIAADSNGNLYAGGSAHTPSDRNGFVLKYSSSGSLLAISTVGTPAFDDVFGIATDSANNVLVCGQTFGAFPGFTNSGWSDAFVQKFPLPDSPGLICIPETSASCCGSPNGCSQLGTKICNAQGTGYGPCVGAVARFCAPGSSASCCGFPNGCSQLGTMICNAEGTWFGPCVGSVERVCTPGSFVTCCGFPNGCSQLGLRFCNQQGTGYSACVGAVERVCTPGSSAVCCGFAQGCGCLGERLCNGDGSGWGSCVGSTPPGQECN